MADLTGRELRDLAAEAYRMGDVEGFRAYLEMAEIVELEGPSPFGAGLGSSALLVLAVLALVWVTSR